MMYTVSVCYLSSTNEETTIQFLLEAEDSLALTRTLNRHLVMAYDEGFVSVYNEATDTYLAIPCRSIRFVEAKVTEVTDKISSVHLT